MMKNEDRHPAAIDPRFLRRLCGTLVARLKEIEVLRDNARRLLTDVRDRIDRLEKTYGLPLGKCRVECDRLLQCIRDLSGPTLPTQEDVDVLRRQIAELPAMIARATEPAPAEGAP